MSNTELVTCYNRGCGQKFDLNKNSNDGCVHHPGFPIFHDAYKGWSCCKKKSTDFTEFLNFKGCTKGPHSNIKPEEPEKPAKSNTDDVCVTNNKPLKSAMKRPDFNSPLEEISPKVAENLKKQIDELPKIEETKKETDNTEITVGTVCKNSGCNYSYENEESLQFECVHHPGVPVFHEGYKYWSCCTKRTTDFTAFMSQIGCATGKHKWIADDSESKAVKCRYDWHQTASTVVVTVYAKLYDYKTSSVKVNPIRLILNLIFPKQNNFTFHLDLELRGIVDVSKTIVNMMSTKVEIVLTKAEPGSWAKLDFPKTETQKQNESVPEDKNDDNESDVDLDDIEVMTTGCTITELD